jgi:hypothetical protein
MPAVRFGVTLAFQPPESLRALAIRAEALGFDSIHSRRGASPPLRTSPQEEVARAKPALGALRSDRGGTATQDGTPDA